MTGIPDDNYPAFHLTAAFLRDKGFEVVNPADNFDGDHSLPYDTYLREAVRQVSTCDGIALMPGWEKSHGVTAIELPLALSLGLTVYDASTGLVMDMPVVAALAQSQETRSAHEVANELVNGNRQAAYGDARADYAKTSKMWSGLLNSKLTEDITPEEACMMMVCLKLSREQFKHGFDNLVDGMGYLMLVEKMEKSKKSK